MDLINQMRNDTLRQVEIPENMLIDQNLHNIFMQAPVALTILRGPDFNIELANEKALELWDRKMEHVINKRIFDSFPELKAQGWGEILQHVYTTGEKYISDETPFFLKRNGQLQAVYINFVYEALKDPNGKITGIMGVGVDVTDQVKARHETQQVDIHDRNIMTAEFEKLVEKRTNELSTKNIQLKKSEERYHKMIDEIQDYAIILIDREGIIQNWNKGAEKIKGYKTEEILGKHFRIFYQREDQEKKLPELMLANATKFGRAMHEGWRVRKDGSKFWGSVTVTALHDENQNIIGFTKITRDLTDIKIANDELKEFAKKLELKNIDLERMNSELEQFAYVASHDLQEPLRKIRTYSGILSENLQSQSTGASIQILNKILNAGERMSTLIYDLLNFSRLASPSNSIEPTDLNKTLQKVIDDFELKIEQKQAQIHLDALPIINAIPLQMNQLFHNLLNNSLKFSKLGASPIITIKSKELKENEIHKFKKLQPGRRYVDISISDNGIGFNQQYAEQIFEVFKRLENKNIYPGSGIGLALCRKIIINHEGEIYGEGKENQGATFHVILPIG